MPARSTGRSRGRGTHVKLSITVPAELARAAEERVISGEAPSVSAVVTSALRRDFGSSDDELDRLFDEWLSAGLVTITDADREWVHRALDL